MTASVVVRHGYDPEFLSSASVRPQFEVFLVQLTRTFVSYRHSCIRFLHWRVGSYVRFFWFESFVKLGEDVNFFPRELIERMFDEVLSQ